MPSRLRQPVLWLWLACLAVAAGVSLRTTYVADLSAFLPSAPTAEQAVLLDQLRSGASARVVLIGIEGGDERSRIDASLRLAATLRAGDVFEAVYNGDTTVWQQAGKFLFEHRYLLSPAVDRERFSAEGLRAAIEETVGLLGTPAGGLIKPVILRDPTGETVRIAETMLPAHPPRSVGGVWVSRHAPRAVMLAITRAEGSDIDGQQRALEFVRESFAPHVERGLQLVLSGPGALAVHSRALIKSEVERLAIAGAVLIALLLWLVLGSLRVLPIAMLPVASGVLAGIAAVSLGFGQVHGITLGFGITLIGEAVDYAIYYLLQVRPTPAAGKTAKHWIATNWPTVRLGLGTSLAGFGALIFSGFPGLAQLGVFSVAGLLAAALTTRYIFPVLVPDGAPGSGMRAQLGQLTRRAAGVLPKLRPAFVVASLLAVAALWLMPSAWRGDLASLSPLDAQALKVDAALRADVGAAEAGTLVVLSAADEPSALTLAEAAGQRLDRLVAQGDLLAYDSPARLLPSPATQTARRDALPDADTLRQRLAQATAQGPLKAERLAGFVVDVQAARGQRVIQGADLVGTPLQSTLDALLTPGGPNRPWRALLTLHAGAQGIDRAKVSAALFDLQGVQVVDIRGELDAMYARYLREASWQALLGALAVCLLLAFHLRSWRRLVQVLQPIAAAIVIVLAALAASGAVLGILHLVGLLLVVAIGSNYALFFDHLSHQATIDDDTLASLSLANLTAVLAFGLLAFSKIPALYAIGQVVAPGALLCLVLSGAFIIARRA